MKKIILAGMLMTTLIASDGADYFGISAGNAEFKMSDLLSSESNSNTQVSVTLGHYYEDSSRVSATYTYVKHDRSVDNNDAISLAYDFMLPLVKNRFSMYAGPVIGYTRLKDSAIDLSGFHYGAQAGAIVRLFEKIEIEAGYRYLRENGSDSGIELDDIKMWYAGANLRF